MMAGSEIHPSRLSLGTRVNLITGAQYRYEGVVAAINSIDGTLALQNVKFWGTENRVSGGSATQNGGESKAPAVGSVFDSITFWMSSIMQLWSADESHGERNDLGDKGIVKAGVTVDDNQGRGMRRPRNWWSTGDARSMMRTSPSHGSEAMSGHMGRYSNAPVTPMMSSQPRMLVSYPRRGRNGGMVSRQTNYVPVVPVHPGQNGMRRTGYVPAGNRGTGYRMSNTPVQNGSGNNQIGTVINGSMGPGPRMGGGGRKPIAQPPPQMRPIHGAGDERRFTPQNGGMGAPGGLFVYLPPEMAAAYQSHGINLVPARSSMSRRRGVERRLTPRGQRSEEPEVDCTTPYDFESANAELEAELAKISLNSDDVQTTTGTSGIGSQEPGTETLSHSSSDPNGDIQAAEFRSCHSPSTGAVVVASVPPGNGASGDSSLGVVPTTSTEAVTNAEGHWPLAKGEYYVRDKSFFDQISRSECGPRQSYSSNLNTRGSYNQANNYGGSLHAAYPGQGASMMNTNYGPGNGMGISSAAAAARRERQLNMETFGPMAARATFVPRRRPAGTLPREYLVSASA